MSTASLPKLGPASERSMQFDRRRSYPHDDAHFSGMPCAANRELIGVDQSDNAGTNA